MHIIAYAIGASDPKNLITMGSTNDGLSFAQVTNRRQCLIRGKKLRDKTTVVCHRCKELGHFSYECLVSVPIPATGDKPDTPTDAL